MINEQQLDALISELTDLVRDISIKQILELVTNPNDQEERMHYWLALNTAQLVKHKGIRSSGELELKYLEAFYKKVC